MTIALAWALLASQPAAAGPAPVPPFIQAERTFAARAQLDGQWTAFRAFAAPDAIMMAPGPINAHQFLSRFKTDPPVAVMWWPGKAWVSCDGSLAVTTGPWVRRAGVEVGTFTTAWRREADGSWKWVYDNARPIPRAVEPPEVPPVRRAPCPGEPEGDHGDGTWLQQDGRMPGEWGYPLVPMPSAPPVAQGRSRDGTLRWEVHHTPEWGPNAYTFQVISGSSFVLFDGHGYTVPPPPDPEGAEPEAQLPPLPAPRPPEPSPYLWKPAEERGPPIGLPPPASPPPPPRPQ